MRHSLCIHELTAAMVSCIKRTQDRPCQAPSRNREKALGALLLTAELLTNERLWKRELLFLGVHTMS